MTLEHVDIFFQIIAFLFAISVHESAHAWSALKCGDPTAYMLGRVTLNPIKHIDPIGTIVVPVIAALSHFGLIGWAKPTPVNTRNLKRYVRDDVIVSLAGIAMNLVVALSAVALLLAMIVAVPGGRTSVNQVVSIFERRGIGQISESVTFPLSLLMYEFMRINVLLACFNIIPVPPLDGSHVLRHFLPQGIRNIYDNVGRFGLLLLMFFSGSVLTRLMNPVLSLFHSVLHVFLS